MEMIYVLFAILQSVAISLGVGSSTLAIVNFFVAIADGKIDEAERRMMGVVYTVLRVAMVAIFITTSILALFNLLNGYVYFTPYTLAQWTLILVLFSNAVLMTKRIMPSTVGPALQASTWYTLGILMSLVPLQLIGFSYFQFVIGYLAAFTLGVSIVNGVMAHLKQNKPAV